MGRLSIFVMLCSVVMAIPVARGIEKGPKAVEEWFQKLGHAEEKVTKLHFYFHDVVEGKSPTAYTVAKCNITDKSPTFFGLLRMVDNPLTAGPKPSSRILGRAQGIYGSAGLEGVGLLMNMNFVFTDGKHNGSTLSLLARNSVFDEYREMPIVGGSGVFRLARGIATAKTHSFNITSGNAIVKYHVTVTHY
ncbi:dirigent protein 19-like [Cornus florida]|uniref:dirigent protein 19-like n=1 Tax=Cornus florida TaxID=4283 RepID=UPI002898B818|nr:dirigent protein 19-like [Cornus florida]